MPYRYIALFALAFVTAALGLWLGLSPKPPEPKVVAVAPLPPIAPTPVPIAAPAALPAPKPVPPRPAPPALPPLPQVQVAVAPEHIAPAEAPAPPERPLDIGGYNIATAHLMARISPQAPYGAAAAPSGAPSSFAGPARVTSATGLIVGNVPVELYGIRHAAAADRCGSSDCETAAVSALQARLAEGQVSCRSPKPNMGVVANAICLDSNGVDLGGMLVGDGLALANPRQGSDYLGAQSIARDLRHGLWQSR